MWAELDELDCPCFGTGWADITPDTWEECPIHYHGQLHPESHILLMDNPKQLFEEERLSIIRYQIAQARAKVVTLQNDLKAEQAKVVRLELELINKTPTLQVFPAVKLEIVDD